MEEIKVDINPDYTMMKKQENGLFLSFLNPAVFCFIIDFSWRYCIFALIFILKVLLGDKFPNNILFVESVIFITHIFS